MEKRLLAMGFTLQKNEWVTAWDLPPPPPPVEATVTKPKDERQNP